MDATTFLKLNTGRRLKGYAGVESRSGGVPPEELVQFSNGYTTAYVGLLEAVKLASKSTEEDAPVLSAKRGDSIQLVPTVSISPMTGYRVHVNVNPELIRGGQCLLSYPTILEPGAPNELIVLAKFGSSFDFSKLDYLLRINLSE